jgi:DNA-binding NarL/FixJ family response regulator
MSDAPINILLVDDHNVVRKGLNALLSTPRFRINVVGDAADGLEAIAAARQLQPDVILMDLEMPQMSGIEAIKAIKQENPQARILVLTSFNETDRAIEAIQAGARGFLLKDSTPDELVQAIRSVHRDQVLLPPDLAEQLLTGVAPEYANSDNETVLTDRERIVLNGLVQGQSNKEIAHDLHISPNTVRSHVRNILTKLNASNRTQAALYAIEHNLLDG